MMRFRVWLIVLSLFFAPLAAWPQTNDDEYWFQRIVSAAQVVSARLDHAGRHTGLCIRKGRSSAPPLFESFPYGLRFVVPEGAPNTARVRAARAQAAGIITSAWLRYTGEVNAACIEANQTLRFSKTNADQIYLHILGD